MMRSFVPAYSSKFGITGLGITGYSVIVTLVLAIAGCTSPVRPRPVPDALVVVKTTSGDITAGARVGETFYDATTVVTNGSNGPLNISSIALTSAAGDAPYAQILATNIVPITDPAIGTNVGLFREPPWKLSPSMKPQSLDRVTLVSDQQMSYILVVTWRLIRNGTWNAGLEIHYATSQAPQVKYVPAYFRVCINPKRAVNC